MPVKSFKTNIFDVVLTNSNDDDDVQTSFDDNVGQTSLRVAIDNAISQSLSGRYRELGGKGRRLENSMQREGCYLLNFVTLEYTGPGRSDPTSAAVPFDLELDESFAHETALLYDPDEGLAFVESTQSGMGPGALATYFREFVDDGTVYQLVPRLDSEASARARRQRTIRSLTMRVSMGPITGEDNEAGVGTIKAFGSGYGAGVVDIVI